MYAREQADPQLPTEKIELHAPEGSGVRSIATNVVDIIPAGIHYREAVSKVVVDIPRLGVAVPFLGVQLTLVLIRGEPLSAVTTGYQGADILVACLRIPPTIPINGAGMTVITNGIREAHAASLRVRTR